jgi:acetyltransferase-like isoleucine patch superfamily enzyme
MAEPLIWGAFNRVLQTLARFLPGAKSLRVRLHRLRGVTIGPNVWIGYDVIIDSSHAHVVSIGEGSALHARVLIVAHFRETRGVKIGRQVTIGPGAIVLPGITIGDGAVITAGSVVTHSVPPMTLVQGNPAKPIAKIGIPMTGKTSLREWAKHLRPIR